MIRARSPEQQRAIVERVLAVWEKNPDLRLGQLLAQVMLGLDAEHPVRKMLYVEDDELAERCELLKGWEPLK